MNDATTSTILDSTGNDNDGAKVGANEPIEAAGKIGKGQDNADASHHIDVGTSAVFDITESITISFWIKSNDEADGGGIFAYSIANWAYNTGYILTSRPYQGGLLFSRYGSAAVSDLWCTTETKDGMWHYCVARYDGTGHTWRVDDASAGSNSTVLTCGSASGAVATIFNKYDTATGLVGILDEVRISSIFRSAAWIAYEYANMNPADGGLTWGAEKNVKSAIHMLFEG
jgi:hypothetical protein